MYFYVRTHLNSKKNFAPVNRVVVITRRFITLLLERDPLIRSYHFRRRNLYGPRKGKGHYGVASVEKMLMR